MDFAEPPAAPDPVRRYLSELELELLPHDAAMRHDALIDAEAHLRAAIAAGSTAERAIADYGSPAEIAAAYVAAERAEPAWRGAAASAGAAHRTAPEGPAVGAPMAAGATGHAGIAAEDSGARGGAGADPRRFRIRDVPVVGIWADARAWGALAYFGAIGFALSVAYFAWSVTVGALAIGLSPLIVGIPVFIFLLGSARALCLFEGKVVEVFLGVRMPRRTQPVEGADTVGFWQRIWCWLRDIRSWLSLAYLLGNFPVAVVLFAVTVAIAFASAILVGVPVLEVLGVHPIQVHADEGSELTIQYLGQELAPDADGTVRLPPALAVVSFAVGVALATAGLWLMRGLGWVYGHVVQAIQVARPRATVPPRG